MLTKEVREWLYRVRSGMYSYETAMCELERLSKSVTKEEIILLKNKLKETVTSSSF